MNASFGATPLRPDSFEGLEIPLGRLWRIPLRQED